MIVFIGKTFKNHLLSCRALFFPGTMDRYRVGAIPKKLLQGFYYRAGSFLTTLNKHGVDPADNLRTLDLDLT
jgi:hypothetical protein